MTTQAGSKVERKHGGLPNWALLGVGRNQGRLACYWPYTTEINGQRFLTRLMVVRTPYIGVDITRVHMADNQREFPHDHSRTFFSWKLGSYDEDVYYDPEDLKNTRHRRHRMLSIHRLGHDQAHSITRVSPHLVTVLLTLRQRHTSHYWTPEGMQATGVNPGDGRVQGK